MVYTTTMQEAKIITYSKKGHGQTEQGCQVPRTIRGERILFKKLKKKKGELLSVVEPSFSRIEPRCQHFSSCGGCSSQHLEYSVQLQEKHTKIQALFPKEVVEPVLSIEMPYGYRNKMEFSFSKEGIGLIPIGGRFAMPITDCQLVDPWMMKVLSCMQDWREQTGYLSYWPARDLGTLRHLMVRSCLRSEGKMVVLCVSGRPEYGIVRKDLDLAVQMLKETSEEPISIFLHVWQSLKGQPTQHYHWHLSGPAFVQEELSLGFLDQNPLVCNLGPQGFFQPSTRGAEVILETLYSLLQPLQGGVLFDLCCGSGLLGMGLSSLFKQVIGVELSKESILDGKQNLSDNKITNVELIQSDVFAFLQATQVQPDVIVFDPPRSGLDPKVFDYVSAPYIAYVSCNPTTQARDIELLQDKGYQIQKIQPIDQFPQTPHVENIALLKKKF